MPKSDQYDFEEIGIPREMDKIERIKLSGLARSNIVNQTKMSIRFESTILYYENNFTDFTRLVQVGNAILYASTRFVHLKKRIVLRTGFEPVT